jgi:hypothetical protein
MAVAEITHWKFGENRFNKPAFSLTEYRFRIEFGASRTAAG